MISIFTGIAAAISLIQLLIMIVRGGKNQNIYQLMLFIMIFISNIGYFLLGISKSVDAAILSNNITYLGAVFMPYFVLLTIADLCGEKLSRKINYPVLLCSLLVLGLVFSVGYSDIYYSNVYIDKLYGTTHLFKEYGPAHNSYKVLLFVDVIVCIYIVIKAIYNNRNFAKKAVFSMLTVLVGPCIVYIVERVWDSPIEFLPFAYVIVAGIYLSMEAKMRMYDMSSSIVGAYEKMEEYGYITFDLKKNLMNCNSTALNMFPELGKTEIDESVDKSDSVFYREIIRWFDLPDLGEYNEKKIKVGNRSIKCTVRKIHMGLRKKIIGCSVELEDNTKQEDYIKLINNYNSKLEEEVKEKTMHIHAMQESIITGMASVVESRDNSTGGHIRRTSACVRILADELRKDERFSVSDTFLDNLIKAAPMHDMGKIAVDDSVLRKPGRFTDEEYEKMKKHSEEGAKIVAEILREIKDEEFKEIAINVAHYHHEKWDGSGYPQKLRGIDIPLEARIMALADVFDALVSKRCYKEAYDYNRAFDIIQDSLGSHFDPEIGKIFIGCRDRLEALYNSISE